MSKSPNLSRLVPVSDLTASSFAPFGEVIQNPDAFPQDKTTLQSVSANQGTATKWLDVSHLEDHYHLAPSQTPARSVVNMFVCQPRTLETRDGKHVFPVRILERHPYTPQTFIPLGVCPKDSKARYLVIVAPTLSTPDGSSPRTLRERLRLARPAPYTNDQLQKQPTLLERLKLTRPAPYSNERSSGRTQQVSTVAATATGGKAPKGPGSPDLDSLQAFIVRGDQAVTYGPGTWHAPMVALDTRALSFVVLQYANGVAREDCQEVEVPSGEKELAVVVSDDGSTAGGGGGGQGEAVVAAAPEIVRAKL